MQFQKILLIWLYCAAYAVDAIIWKKIFDLVFISRLNKKREYFLFFLMYFLVVFKRFMCFGGYLAVTSIFNFLMMFLVFYILQVLYYGDLQRKIQVYIIYYVVAISIEYIIILFAGTVLNMEVERLSLFGYDNLYLLMFSVLLKLFVYKITKLLAENKKNVFQIEDAIPAIIAFFLLVIPVCFATYEKKSIDFRIFNGLWVVQFMVEVLSIFNVFCIVWNQKKRKLKKMETVDFIRNQLKIYWNLKNNTKEMDGFEENIRLKLCKVLELLKTENNNQAEKYIRDLISEITFDESRYELEKRIFLITIYQEKLRAESKKIHVTYNINIRDIPMSVADLHIIINNMFRNAVKVCLQIAEEEKRYISFQTIQTKGKICIICRNSFIQDVINQQESLANKGIKIIQKIVVKNNGELQVRFNHQEFVIKAIFEEAFTRYNSSPEMLCK